MKKLPLAMKQKNKEPFRITVKLLELDEILKSKYGLMIMY